MYSRYVLTVLIFIGIFFSPIFRLSGAFFAATGTRDADTASILMAADRFKARSEGAHDRKLVGDQPPGIAHPASTDRCSSQEAEIPSLGFAV